MSSLKRLGKKNVVFYFIANKYCCIHLKKKLKPDQLHIILSNLKKKDLHKAIVFY